jgi:hypothetical protein
MEVKKLMKCGLGEVQRETDSSDNVVNLLTPLACILSLNPRMPL